MNACTRLLFYSMLLSSFGIMYSQQQKLNSDQEAALSYPIPGSHLLQKDDAKVREYYRRHPHAAEQMRLQKSSGWDFVVGSEKSWKAVNIQTEAFYDVPSTCRAVGTWCYIFVENASWDVWLTQSVVDSIKKAFDQSTPANSSKGIYQMNVDAFGDPPDVDGDSKIIILILDIKDGFSGSGGYAAGYFHSVNELPKSEESNSNEAEIYYLDSYPAALTIPEGLVTGMSVTTHEFQHMIHWNYDKDEINFVQEGISLIAEVNAGYPLYSQVYFTGEPNRNILQWSSNITESLKDYSRAARYMLYLRDHFSMAVFKPMVQSTAIGIAGIDTALKKFGASLRFTDVTRNWLIANIINNVAVDSAYGYTSGIVSPVKSHVYSDPNIIPESRAVEGYAAEYLSFVGAAGLSVTFTLQPDSPLEIKAVKTGIGLIQIMDVEGGTPFQIPESEGTISKVTFIIMNADSSDFASYLVEAKGKSGFSSYSVLSYAGSPVSSVRLPSEDKKVAMRFTPDISGRVYSVSVGIDSAIKGNGNLKISVAENKHGSEDGIPSTQIGSAVTIPFNTLLPAQWNEIDMIGANVNITKGTDFHIVLEVEGNTGDTLSILFDNEFTWPRTRFSSYRNGLNGLNWYNRGDSTYSDGWNRKWDNLVIAVIIALPTGVEENSLNSTPLQYAFSQNYPNPFNPSTTISYSLQNAGNVTLKVYDILGKEVATLVNGYKSSGRYNITFNASQLSSGMYFYRLDAGSYRSVKKMMLIK